MSNTEPIIDSLLLRLEKIETKFDVTSDFEKSMNEQMSNLSEKIGELKSMILEREKSVAEVESDVVKIGNIVHSINPDRYLKDLKRQERNSLELSARLEKLEDSVGATRGEMERAGDKLDKIGDLHSLSEFHRDIEKMRAEVDDRAKKVRELTSEMESLFVELSKKLPELSSVQKRVDSLQAMMGDVMKDSSRVVVKLEKLEKMGLIFDEVSDKEPPWLRERFNEVDRKLVGELGKKSSEIDSKLAGIKAEMKSMGGRQSDIEALKSIYDLYNESKSAGISELRDEVNRLRSEIDDLRAKSEI